jgi:hypothetical protein
MAQCHLAVLFQSLIFTGHPQVFRLGKIPIQLQEAIHLLFRLGYQKLVLFVLVLAAQLFLHPFGVKLVGVEPFHTVIIFQ